MSTHPSILGDMIRQETQDGEKTSLDIERDLGIPADAGPDPDEPAAPRPGLPDTERQPGERRQRIQSE